jgi:hypothetical protein
MLNMMRTLDDPVGSPWSLWFKPPVIVVRHSARPTSRGTTPHRVASGLRAATARTQGYMAVEQPSGTTPVGRGHPAGGLGEVASPGEDGSAAQMYPSYHADTSVLEAEYRLAGEWYDEHDYWDGASDVDVATLGSATRPSSPFSPSGMVHWAFGATLGRRRSSSSSEHADEPNDAHLARARRSASASRAGPSSLVGGSRGALTPPNGRTHRARSDFGVPRIGPASEGWKQSDFWSRSSLPDDEDFGGRVRELWDKGKRKMRDRGSSLIRKARNVVLEVKRKPWFSWW